MTDPKTLPSEIAASVDRKFTYGWCPRIRGPQLLHFEKLTLTDLEQLTKHYKRRAYSALKRYDRTGSPRTAATAADDIWHAECYRIRLRELLGDDRPDDFADTDPVFPEFRWPK